MQLDAWGYGDRDVVPAAIFSVARNFGGQALGAFDHGRMVGFALAFGSVGDGQAHFHSHMVAVIPEYQNKGLGRQIKVAQRQDALRRGINQVVWTFDPLQVRNAYFNIAKLGGICVRYIPNLYGKTSSPLHSGMPTDRLVVEWDLDSPRVHQALGNEPAREKSDAIVVPIPAIEDHVTFSDRLARQTALRERLMMLMSSGYVITGLIRKEDTASYVLESNQGFTEK